MPESRNSNMLLRFGLICAGFCTDSLDSSVVGQAGLLCESSGGSQVDGSPPVEHVHIVSA